MNALQPLSVIGAGVIVQQLDLFRRARCGLIVWEPVAKSPRYAIASITFAVCQAKGRSQQSRKTVVSYLSRLC